MYSEKKKIKRQRPEGIIFEQRNTIERILYYNEPDIIYLNIYI